MCKLGDYCYYYATTRRLPAYSHDRLDTAIANSRIRIDRSASQFVSAVCALLEVAEQTQRTVVNDLEKAQNRHAHEQANQAATVGQKFCRTVQLGAVRRNELFLFVEDGQAARIFSVRFAMSSSGCCGLQTNTVPRYF